MKIENVRVYDLEECIKASKYPMSVDNSLLNSDITNTVKKLAISPKGEGHDQFLTGIRVSFDLTCSNKMWIEAERYRFLEFVSSQSTMHRISKFNIKEQCNQYVDSRVIDIMNEKKEEYLKNKTEENFLRLIYNIPSGFELTARMTTNYRCLKGIYSQRKNHRLPEWREFCAWCESLPYFKKFFLEG